MRSPRLQMPAAVDPAAEVGRGGHVGRDGHHVLGDLGRLVGELDEQAPERLLGGARPRVRAPELGGHRRRLVALDGLALQARRHRARTAAPRPSPCSKARHGSCGVGAELLGEVEELLVVEQRRVVGGMALGGQRPALDRVGEDDRRAVAHGVGGAVGGEQRLEVVAAEVAEGGQQLARAEVGDQPRDGLVAAGQALAQLRVVGAQQALVLLVAHRVDARAQRLAAVAARRARAGAGRT